MAFKLLFYFIGIFFLNSCQFEKNKNANDVFHKVENAEDSILSRSNNSIEVFHKMDSISSFVVDQYPIKNEEFKDNIGKNNTEEIVSFDTVWFKNSSIHQSLIFELYTDYHRLVTYHFDHEKISDKLLEIIELHNKNGTIASLEVKKYNFKTLIDQSIEIDSTKFISHNGIFIGMQKSQAIELYGIPDIIDINSDFDILEWQFLGELTSINMDLIQKKLVAKKSYGHNITMYFKEKQLVAQILFNEIP